VGESWALPQSSQSAPVCRKKLWEAIAFLNQTDSSTQ